MLSIEHLAISFKQRDILRDVSLHFQPGLHFLIGPNGSGKTSILRSLMGLIPFKGKQYYNNQDLSTLPPLSRAQLIAWLPQHPSWPAHLSVRDYILLGRFPYLSWLGNYTKRDYKLVEAILRELELQAFARQSLGTLSGGERQQVALARALAQDTPLLLLDEPAQALDPLNKDILYRRLAEVAKTKTVICTTHDLDYLNTPGATISALSANGTLLWQKPSGINKNLLMAEVFTGEKRQ